MNWRRAAARSSTSAIFAASSASSAWRARRRSVSFRAASSSASRRARVGGRLFLAAQGVGLLLRARALRLHRAGGLVGRLTLRGVARRLLAVRCLRFGRARRRRGGDRRRLGVLLGRRFTRDRLVHLADDGARALGGASCSSPAPRSARARARSVIRSTAASVGSLNSLLRATLRISAVSRSASNAARRTDSWSAWRAIDPSAWPSVMLRQRALRGAARGAVFATTARSSRRARRRAPRRRRGSRLRRGLQSPRARCRAACRSPARAPFVGVALGHAGERRGIHQLGDRRAAHARVGVLPRDFRQQLALVERNLLDECQADGGVGVFLTGLRAESIE